MILGELRWCVLVNTVALVAAIASSDPGAAQQVTPQAKAGVLTCDVSAGIGLIVGSQKQISCAFAPQGPGRREDYDGYIAKYGLDLGLTSGGFWCGRFSRKPSQVLGSCLATITARAAK
jgi:hypothetical protein